MYIPVVVHSGMWEQGTPGVCREKQLLTTDGGLKTVGLDDDSGAEFVHNRAGSCSSTCSK